MKRLLLGILLVFIPAVATPPFIDAAASTAAQVVYQPLPKPGEKVTIDAHHYFTFGFDKAPKIGVAVLRVEVFTLTENGIRRSLSRGMRICPP